MLTLRVLTLALAFGNTSQPNLTGINIGAPNNFAGDRLFTDMMRTARLFYAIGNDQVRVATDAKGWPTVTDFATYVAESLDNMHGTYTLVASGKVGGVSGSFTVTAGPSYDPGTNTTTATLTYSQTESTNLWINITGAYRDGAQTQPGLLGLKLMRPTSPGSGTSYPASTLVSAAITSLVQKFSAVRYLDMDSTNWSQVKEWAGADVPLWQPSHAYTVGQKVRWGRMPATTIYQATASGMSGTAGPKVFKYATWDWFHAGDQVITSAGNIYLCMQFGQAGGTPPTGTGTGIVDGNTAWNYVGTSITDGSVTWSIVGESRTLPGVATYNYDGGVAGFGWSGHGVDWETIIQIANAFDRDAWINLPVWATDEFLIKTLQVFKCGSDGLDPWVNTDGSCKASPAYPPLASNLKLYLEYSNEAWNYQFSQAGAVDTLAAAEPAGTPIHFDGYNGEDHTRFYAMRSAQISLVARSVFGDAAMLTRVRPILSGQSANIGGPGGIQVMLRWLFNYADNGAGSYVPNANWVIPGTSTQVDAHPPNWYFYGAGGAAYYGPSDESSVTALLTTGEMDSTYWITGQKWTTDVDIPPAYGLKRVAYEGGPSFDSPTTSDPQGYKTTAYLQDRPNTPNMRDVLIDHHNAWSQHGGDLLMYLTSVADFRWGFTPSVYSQATAKLNAITDLSNSPRAAISTGQPIPGSLPGAAWLVKDSGSALQRTQTTATGSVTLTSSDPSGGRWTGYVFRADTLLTRSTVTLSKTGTGTALVYLDGAPLSSKDGGTTWDAGTLSHGLHGIIVLAVSGSLGLDAIGVQ